MSALVNLSDEELVDFVRKKDKESYIEVVRRYQNKLSRYVNYIIRDENQSDDIVQNTFIKAYKNLHGFNTKRKFSSNIIFLFLLFLKTRLISKKLKVY